MVPACMWVDTVVCTRAKVVCVPSRADTPAQCHLSDKKAPVPFTPVHDWYKIIVLHLR